MIAKGFFAVAGAFAAGVFAVAGAFAAGIALLAVTALPSAFLLMLSLGAAHDIWPSIPPLGFWSTWLMLAGLGSIAATLRRSLSLKFGETKKPAAE